MDARLADPHVNAEAILKLIKEALSECRRSNSSLYGLVRGLEIGISTLGRTRSTACESITELQERWLRLSQTRDDYQLAVALGIQLAIDVASVIASKLSTVS